MRSVFLLLVAPSMTGRSDAACHVTKALMPGATVLRSSLESDVFRRDRVEGLENDRGAAFHFERKVKIPMRTFLVFLLTLCIQSMASAAESSGPRLITQIGCHDFNGTCFVSVDGAPFGGSLGCSVGASNEVRWDNASDPAASEGRRAFAAMYAAFLAGKHVVLVVDGCTYQGAHALSYYLIN